MLKFGELPGVHGGGAEVADLPGLDDVVEGLHGLCDWSLGIEAVDLVEVDVVGAEPGQGGVDLLNDRCAGQALPQSHEVHQNSPLAPVGGHSVAQDRGPAE